MKTYLDCIPCFIRQTLDAAQIATRDTDIHEQAVREILKAASTMNFKNPPPYMGQRIYHLIQDLTHNADPYKSLKDQFNAYALSLYPALKEQVKTAVNPIETAARLAIAGNIIDFGACIVVDRSVVDETISSSLDADLFGSSQRFEDAVASASNILYLGDNTGEIVFDRILIEELPRERVTFVVRGGPVINDVTMSDAVDTGMTEIVEVIDSGSDTQGIIFEKCSESFNRSFAAADLVIAKGQGNYETLSEIEKPIYFLLKAKCPVVARHIGCGLGSLVIGQAGDFKSSGGKNDI